MKIGKLFIGISVFIFYFTSPAFAEIKSMSLQIDGLSCPFCALSLEKKLKSVDGISKVDVHLKKAITDLTLKPTSQLDLEAVQTAVKEAGFTLKDIRVRVSGNVIQDNDGFFLIESQGDKTRFSLFDENHTDVNSSSPNSHVLDANVEKQLLKAQEDNKTVEIEGIIHQHADMPFSLLIKTLEVKSE
ncbi:MAG: heavy-metal-associated domain-containing protein [Candidatus Scalindua sp.]